MDLSWQPSDEPCRADYADFSTRYPAYRRTASLDELRTREFARIDAVGCVYMDYGGAALYSERLVETHGAFLRQAILGNPHSRSLRPSRLGASEDAVLDFFCAGPEYRVLFSNNASRAGIHVIFGAFVLGALIPHDSRLARELTRKLEDLVVVLFLPAFFAFRDTR